MVGLLQNDRLPIYLLLGSFVNNLELTSLLLSWSPTHRGLDKFSSHLVSPLAYEDTSSKVIIGY